MNRENGLPYFGDFAIGVTGVTYIQPQIAVQVIPDGPRTRLSSGSISGPCAERDIDRMTGEELFDHWITCGYDATSTFQEWLDRTEPKFLHLNITPPGNIDCYE